jgi:hypothetical protein
MSNIKISDLGQAGALTGIELVPIVQNNLTLRTTLNQVKAFASIAISNNIIGDAASTTLAPSVNAIKTYADGLVVGLLNDRGNYTPSVSSPGAYPSSGGSGAGGAIQKGDIWFINGNGYLGTTAVVIGVSVRALVNNPSPSTNSDWDILDASLIQSDLQGVLNAGNTANGTITLTNGSQTSILSKDALQLNTSTIVNAANYNAYTFQIINNGGDYISGSTDRLKVYDITTTNSTELKYDSLKYNNSAFVGSLETATLTSSQTWTLPNSTGTIALANNIWNATGNAGTVAGTNFIGTTDAIDFVTKTNNTERLRVLSTGQVKLSSLTGTGTRMVVANSVGQLSTQTITSPTLQTVTTAGNTTTVPIYSEGGFIAQNAVDNSGGAITCGIGNGGILSLTSVVGNGVEIKVDLTTGNRTLQVPDNDGTIALLSDINPGNTWNVVGNAGTTAGTNFIGTTDNEDLVFKTNNVERLRIDNIGNITALNGCNSINDTEAIFFASDSSYIGSAFISSNYSGSGKPTLGLTDGIQYLGIIQTSTLSSNRTYTLPDASGTIALTNTVTLQNVLAGTNKNLTSGINLQGTNAGGGNTGTSSINAFGTNAAQNNSGSYINALGGNAAIANSGNNINALGYAAASSNTGDYVNAIGYDAASSNTGDYVNALGQNAAQNNLGSYVNVLGFSAGEDNIGSNVNGIGIAAASNNTGGHVNAFGATAANLNTGTYINALGYQAAVSNQGDNVNALGYEAAMNNGIASTYVNAFGYQAAKGNDGGYVNAIGSGALENNTGSNVNAFGNGAGSGNTISGATIFSNASLPSYADYTAASAAITVGAGGTAGCTYLYHDQATNSIGAVRL